MFSHKERVRAIQLFLKYDCSYAATIRELGYPSIGALRKWYKEYLESGELHQEHRKKSKYSEEQKRIAVNHYFEYGQCYARTIRMLGYPNRESLRQRCEELAPGARKLRKSAVKLTQDQKEAVLKKFYKPQTNRKNLAESGGISRVTLYQWKNTVLGKDFPLCMTLKNQEKQKELLLKEVEDLQKQVHQLQLEKALLEGAAELLKKEKGVNLLCLSNQEKTILIDALRNQFTLKELLQQLQFPKSSYFYQKQALEKLVKKGCEAIPIFANSVLTRPSLGFNKYNHKIEITTKDITTGAKKATLKKIFPLRFLLIISAIPKAAPIWTGIIQTTNLAVFQILFTKIGSANSRLKFSKPINCLASGVNK